MIYHGEDESVGYMIHVQRTNTTYEHNVLIQRNRGFMYTLVTCTQFQTLICPGVHVGSVISPRMHVVEHTILNAGMST